MPVLPLAVVEKCDVDCLRLNTSLIPFVWVSYRVSLLVVCIVNRWRVLTFPFWDTLQY